MAVGRENGIPGSGGLNGDDHRIRYIPLSYDSANSQESALDLVLAIRPEWTAPGSNVEFVRFTDGITNTLLKAVNKRPGLSKDEVDREAILLRAYGHGTDLIIDRHRETQNHELLMRYGLAPELLARFENGMMYRFIQGAVTHPEDLRRPDIYRAVARRLAEWHAVVPCISGRTGHSRRNSKVEGFATAASALDSNLGDAEFQQALDGVAPGKPPPNVWTVMQKWIFALPTDTDAQRARQASLQQELKTLVAELSQRPGLGANGVSRVPSLPKPADRELTLLFLPAHLRPLRSPQRQRHRAPQAPLRRRRHRQERADRDLHRLRVRDPVPCRLRPGQPLRRVGRLRLRLFRASHARPAPRVRRPVRRRLL